MLNFVTTMNGALSVMMVGGGGMLELYADNWDSLHQVETDIAVRLGYIC